MSCELGLYLLSGQPKAPLSVSISQALEDIKLYEGKTQPILDNLLRLS